MKKLVAVLTIVASLFASPALAQEDNRWNVTVQETVWDESWIAQIGVTRFEGEPVNELLVVGCNPGPYVSICIDYWNSTPFSGNDIVQDAVGETDLEAELSFHRLVRGVTVRVKGAVYMIEGEDLYSLRFAIDRALGDSCSGTVSVEMMTGAFEFQVYKLSGACSRALGDDWNISAEAGVAYNTLNEQTVLPVEGRLMRGQRVSGGFVFGLYATEGKPELRAGLRLVLRN